MKKFSRIAAIVSIAFFSVVFVGCSRDGTLSVAKPNANSSTVTQLAKPLVSPIVTIPQAQELFTPFIESIEPNTTVIWKNSDTVAHTIMTTKEQSTYINPQAFSFTAFPGQEANFTFTKPGIYHYYESTQAKWDSATNRVAANKGVPNYPLAMDGVIWVHGSISDAFSSATNSIPDGADDFVNEFLVVKQGGKISWHNSDTDLHIISTVPGWSAPINPDHTTLGVIQLEGTLSVKKGGIQTISFNTPGLYYYYCPAHANINAQWHRAVAHTDASIYPIPMEGFVLVVGN